MPAVFPFSGDLTALGQVAGLAGASWEVEMSPLTNDVLAALLQGATWTKSRHSNPSGDCVELAELVGQGIAVRNSRYPAGPALVCSHAEIAVFIRDVKNGGFDKIER